MSAAPRLDIGGDRHHVRLARYTNLFGDSALQRNVTSPTALPFMCSGLDTIRADVINDPIFSLVDDLRMTALPITRDMASAGKIAHRVAMLYQGKIIWHGPRDPTIIR